MKKSKERDCSKNSSFAILRSGIKTSQMALFHSTFERHTHIVQKTEWDKINYYFSEPDVFDVK